MIAASTSRALFALAISTTLLGACKSNPPATPDDASNTEVAEPVETTPQALSVDLLISRIEALRDRPLNPPLNIQAHETIPPSLLEATPLPTSVSTAHKALSKHLDAEVVSESDLVLPAAPSESLAIYDPSTHTLHHLQNHTDPVALRGAITRAIVDAIDHHLLAQARQPVTLDAWLAQRASSEGDAMFVSLVHELDQTTPDQLGAALIARSPELIWNHEEVIRQLGPGLYGEDDLMLGTYSFTQREGANFIAAMVRAHGWSGAEVALSMPPTSSAHVIDPARWLAGNQDASWTLPEAWVKERTDAGWTTMNTGQVGAVWTTMWLARARTRALEKIDPNSEPALHERTLADLSDQALQVIPASWRADQWQVMERGEHSLFIWTSQWEAPTSASYVSRMLDAAITSAHLSQPNLSMRCAVADEGLQITVLCSDDASLGKPQLEEQSALLARSARVGYRTTLDIPLQFKPSTAQRLISSAQKMTLDEAMLWSDPGLGLAAKLDNLVLYSPQTTDTGLIRWYGVYDGATIQLSAEPLNPLKPKFDSPEYADALSTQIMATLPEAKTLGAELVTHPQLGKAHTLGFEASFNGTPHQIYLWHMKHEDVVLTLSINAPKDRAAEARALTSKVFEALHTTP